MRKFLRRLRKGLKTACLTAALTTCWQIGQVAKADISPPNWGDEITVKFAGTVSPTVNDISHLYFIYITGTSSVDYEFNLVKLGDFSAGQSTPFSVLTTTHYYETIQWFAAGLYGNIGSGQYIEGTNGVTLGINALEGDSWSSHIVGVDEGTMFTHLMNDDYVQLSPENYHVYPNSYYPMDSWTTSYGHGLFDFSQASNNGQFQVQYEVVPEPVSIVLFGTGGMIVVALRRRRYSNR